MNHIMLFNATGMQGSAIARRLLSKGYQVSSAVRSEEKKESLKQSGIDAFITDFETEDLISPLKETDQVILQIPAQVSPSVMIQLSENITYAIKEAGSPPTLFVISSTVPEEITGRESPDARLRMRNLAMEALPGSVVLSATEYLENFSTAYRQAIETDGFIPQTIPETVPVNYLSWEDLATYVVAAMESKSLSPGFYQIGGNEAITGVQLAQRLGNVLGKKLRYHTLTHQQLSEYLTPIVGQQLAAELAEFYEWQDLEGFELLNPDTLRIRELLDIQLPSFEEWAAKAFNMK